MELVTFYEFALKACVHCVVFGWIRFMGNVVGNVWLNCGVGCRGLKSFFKLLIEKFYKLLLI